MSLDDVINKAAATSAEQDKPVNRYENRIVFYPINSKDHLSHHLNYLFRTDPQQKWTNNLTPGNAYFFINENNALELQFAENQAKREELKTKTRSSIRKRAKAADMKMDEFAQTIKLARLDYLDNNVFQFTPRVKDASVELIKDLYRSLPGFDMICSVVHTDQRENYVHIHFLFCLNK